MNFFEELFCGQRCPIEEIADLTSKSEKYKRMTHQIAEASEILEKNLSGEVLEAYFRYRDGKNDDIVYLQTAAFKLGYIYGMQMQREIQETEAACIEMT